MSQDKWVEWYMGVRDGLIRARGVVGNSSITGMPLPRLNATDTLLLAALATKEVLRALRQDSWESKVWESRTVEPDGELLSGYNVTQSLDPEIYLSTGIPDGQPPYRRSIMSSVSNIPIATFEPARPNQVGLVGGMREMMYPWQRLIDKGADILRGGTLRMLTLSEVEGIMREFYQCTLAASAVLDFPPQSTRDLAADAAVYALDQGATALGNAAAVAAEAVGETVGTAAAGFSEGFFGRAGFTSLVVGGIVVYLAVR